MNFLLFFCNKIQTLVSWMIRIIFIILLLRLLGVLSFIWFYIWVQFIYIILNFLDLLFAIIQHKFLFQFFKLFSYLLIHNVFLLFIICKNWLSIYLFLLYLNPWFFRLISLLLSSYFLLKFLSGGPLIVWLIFNLFFESF